MPLIPFALICWSWEYIVFTKYFVFGILCGIGNNKYKILIINMLKKYVSTKVVFYVDE